MAVSDRPNTERVYRAVSQWVEACLRNEGSLFTPGRPVWTSENFAELHDRFNSQPDNSGDSFLAKLRRQLDEADSDVVQLMGELLYVHLLVANDIGGPAKRKLINEILSWSTSPVALPEDLAATLNSGLANTGVAYKTYRPNQLWFLIDSMRAWKELPTEDREKLLSDPWAFKAFLYDLPIKSAFAQREALLHFVHPDSFEYIVSRDHKSQIRTYYSELAGGEDDIDRALLRIRSALEEEHGERADFYREPFDAWRPAKAEPALATEPGGAWLVRGANVLGTNLVPSWLQEGYCSIGWPEVGELPATVSHDELALRVAAAFPEKSEAQRRSDVGNLWRFLHQMKVGDLVVTVDDSDVYIGHITTHPEWHDTNRRGDMRRRGVEWHNEGDPVLRGDLPPAAKSALNAQPTVCDITKHHDAFLAALGDGPATAAVDVLEHLPAVPAGLAGDLLLPRAWLQGVVDLLEEKRQVIFYGPPGTGKTFLARALADHIVSEGGRVDLVQFHPSYTYEDFFEGFRPRQSSVDETNVAFELVPGPLRRLAEDALKDPAHPYLLVIDEINRANLAKVFGELYFLLEYRHDEITLQYSPDDRFRLPPNLYVIGTMNTADRSIALVDAAMRRRFYFVELSPGRDPIRTLLRDWLKRENLPAAVADLLEELNRRIGDADAAVGPSYLMHRRIDDRVVLERVWTHAVLPLLEEHFIGTGVDVRDTYGLAAIEKALQPASAVDGGDSVPISE